MFTLSRYTHLFSKDKEWYVYNSQSNFLGKIQEELIDILKRNKWEELDEETLKFLQKYHVIELCGHEDDYYDLQHIKFNARAYDPTTLSLVLAPTTACNFKCPYCFEPKLSPKVMTEEGIADLMKFIKYHQDAKRINLTWYGGEPLLAFPQIKKIYEGLKGDSIPAVAHTTMVTNGSLITDEICDFFNEKGLDVIQITLDGNEEQHNRTRCFKAGSAPSFSIIYDNIRLVRKKIPGCRVMIRVNVDKKTLKNFVEVYHKVKMDFEDDPMIHVYPGFIHVDRPDGKALTPECILPCDMVDVYTYFRENGIDKNLFPEKKRRGCMINSLHSYIIGPEGEIYKCWNDVTKPERVVSHINNFKFIDKRIMTRYMLGGSPFSNTCKECKVFPICDTGCGYYRTKNVYESGEFNLCSAFKDASKLEKALLGGYITKIIKVKGEE